MVRTAAMEAHKVVQPTTEEEVTNTQTTGLTQMVRLTPEVRAALSVPVPPSELKYRKGFGGKMLAYTSTEFVEDRLTSIDPDWDDDYIYTESRSAHGVIGTCKGIVWVFGVKRASSGGYFVPDDITYEDKNGNKHTRPIMDSEVHTIIAAVQARTFKRAAAKHGVGRELWGEVVTDQPVANQSNGATQTQTRSTTSKATGRDAGSQASGGGFATPNMLRTLGQLGVPEEVAGQLTLGQMVEGKYNGEASQMIGSLIATRTKDKDAYDEDKGLYVRRALSKIANHLLDEYDAVVAGDVGSEDYDPD